MTIAGIDQRPHYDPTLVDILDRLSYRRVEIDDPSDPVFRLRYDAYRREDFIPFNSQQVLEDHWDSAANARCYGVYIDDQLVSSLRIHVVKKISDISPSKTLWPEVLEPILEAGETYIDPTRFTADHDASLAFPLLPFLTLRIAVMASVHHDVDYCIGAVRREHGAFYRRVFNSELMGEERLFHGLTFPMYLYVAQARAMSVSVHSRYPVFNSTLAERKALFGDNAGYGRMVRPDSLLALRDAQREVEQA